MRSSPFRVLPAIAALEFLRAPGFARDDEPVEKDERTVEEGQTQPEYHLIGDEAEIHALRPKLDTAETD